MTYKFISLPIELASDDLINQQYGERIEETILICYLIESNIMGFSSFTSSEVSEYMCESEEEFHKLVGEYRLLRML